MKEQQQPKTRKKPSISKPENHQHQQETISSTNLSFDFLGSQINQQLLYEVRKKQIDSVLQNMIRCAQGIINQNGGKQYNKVMLLSGAPGTGKTACIKHILQKFINHIKQDKQYRCIKQITVISSNTNSNRNFQQTIQILNNVQQFSKQKQKQRQKSKSLIKIQQYPINCPQGNICLNLLYIQQIDGLLKIKNQFIFGQLMQFFDRKFTICNKMEKNNGKVKVGKELVNHYMLIGACNTINIQQQLKQRVADLKISSIIFAPYTEQSLTKIMKQRLQKIHQKFDITIKIQDKLIRYITTKLKQLKRQDCRNLIQLIKQLLYYATTKPQIKQALERGQNDGIVLEVTLDVLNSIKKIKKILTNSNRQLIQSLNFKQQLILAIVHRYFKNSQSLEMPYLQINQQLKSVHKNMGIVAYEDASVAISQLEAYGCISVRSSTNKTSLSKSKSKTSTEKEKARSKMTVILKVNMNDIEGALSGLPAFTKFFE